MRAIAIAAMLATSGCYDTVRIDDPDGSPPPWDGGLVLPEGKCEEAAGVDLLLVVDNSNSMTEEQVSLVAELPSLISSLVAPPDTDGDGEPDWAAIDDLQIGVVTTDMGTGGFAVPTCTDSDFGDDGILRTRGNSAIEGCMSAYPAVFSFDPETGIDAAQFARDVSCVAQIGTGGCGFEQQLEAMLKALSPSAPTTYTGPDYVPPRFFRDTPGHGDRENAGFVRDDTLLAVLILSDEEDCSAHDPTLFNPSGGPYAGTDINVRCFHFADEALHPIARFVDGLTALRVDRPDLIAFGVIAGIPPDLAVEQPTAADFDAMLLDPRMQEVIDPEMPNRLRPSCNVPDRGIAFPPRRMVSVARALGPGRATVQSICQSSLEPATASLARLFGRRACRRYEE